ncbi:MAG: HAD family hydrolase [Thermodesulfobacteriota bacterium]|nr:HAD family hydrolase [Thermodesulfobacteriota bacterium]
MLYVLDIDDTLYLERDYVRSGFHFIGDWLKKNLHIKDFFKRAWHLFENGVQENIFDIVLHDIGIFDDNLVKYFVKLYRTHCPDISLQSDAKEFLTSQRREDLAIISDGYSCAQWAKIWALNLEQYVDRIVITDDFGEEFWKPSPQAYLLLQDGRTPDECVYIGDNPLKDFDAPAKLGWASSIRIRREGSLFSAIDTPKTCTEIKSLTENGLLTGNIMN